MLFWELPLFKSILGLVGGIRLLVFRFRLIFLNMYYVKGFVSGTLLVVIAMQKVKEHNTPGDTSLRTEILHIFSMPIFWSWLLVRLVLSICGYKLNRHYNQFVNSQHLAKGLMRSTGSIHTY